MKKCANCGKQFHPTRNQIYCMTPCKTLSPEKVKCRELHKTIERYEHEIVNVMSLVQLERKKIEDMKFYRIMFNRVNDYLANSVDPNIEDIKRIMNV